VTFKKMSAERCLIAIAQVLYIRDIQKVGGDNLRAISEYRA